MSEEPLFASARLSFRPVVDGVQRDSWLKEKRG